jgi:hypothetical protein
MQALFSHTCTQATKNSILINVYFFAHKIKVNNTFMFSPDTSPPVFQDCPYVKVGYAERSKTSGRVWWNEPHGKFKKKTFQNITSI